MNTHMNMCMFLCMCLSVCGWVFACLLASPCVCVNMHVYKDVCAYTGGYHSNSFPASMAMALDMLIRSGR
jgi:hypothetical protein